jgi:hypothetical protein
MSEISLQLTFDCGDPRTGPLLGGCTRLEPEDHDELIGQMLAAAACTDLRGRYPRMLFMAVPEGKTARNRLHLDLHLDGAVDREPARESEVARPAREFCVG